MNQPGVLPAELELSFATEFGWMTLGWRGRLVTRLRFLARPPARSRSAAAPEAAECDSFAAAIVERLQRFLAGQSADAFRDVPLELSARTPFQREVLRQCRQIPVGQTMTYAELAARAGRPRAPRAVGQVMASNRFPVIVPCHRVVGANGALGGFSAPTGTTLKRQLLQLEAAFCSPAINTAPRRPTHSRRSP